MSRIIFKNGVSYKSAAECIYLLDASGENREIMLTFYLPPSSHLFQLLYWF